MGNDSPSLGMWFWIIFVIAVIFNFASWDRSTGWKGAAPLVWIVLLGILGWAVFQGPVGK